MTIKRGTPSGASPPFKLARLSSPKEASPPPTNRSHPHLLSLPDGLLFRIAAHVCHGQPTASALALACISPEFRDAIIYSIGHTLTLSRRNNRHATLWFVLGLQSLRKLIFLNPDIPQAAHKLLLSPHVLHIEVVSTLSVLHSLSKRQPRSMLNKLVVNIPKPPEWSLLSLALEKTQPLSLALICTARDACTTRTRNQGCALAWLRVAGIAKHLAGVCKRVDKLQIDCKYLAHPPVVYHVLEHMHTVQEVLATPGSSELTKFQVGLSRVKRIRVEQEGWKGWWGGGEMRINRWGGWQKMIVTLRVEAAWGCEKVRHLQTLSNLESLDIRVRGGAEQELVGVCRAAHRLRKLRVTWGEMKRDGREAEEGVPGAFLAAARECKGLREIGIAGVRMGGLEVDAVVENVGEGLQVLEMEAWGQEERAAERVKRLVEGVRKWGRKVEKFRVVLSDGMGIDEGDGDGVVAAVNRLRQERPLIDLGDLEIGVRLAWGEEHQSRRTEGRESVWTGAQTSTAESSD